MFDLYKGSCLSEEMDSLTCEYNIYLLGGNSRQTWFLIKFLLSPVGVSRSVTYKSQSAAGLPNPTSVLKPEPCRPGTGSYRLPHQRPSSPIGVRRPATTQHSFSPLYSRGIKQGAVTAAARRRSRFRSIVESNRPCRPGAVIKPPPLLNLLFTSFESNHGRLILAFSPSN
jgi:hypothetical protein